MRRSDKTFLRQWLLARATCGSGVGRVLQKKKKKEKKNNAAAATWFNQYREVYISCGTMMMRAASSSLDIALGSREDPRSPLETDIPFHLNTSFPVHPVRVRSSKSF